MLKVISPNILENDIKVSKGEYAIIDLAFVIEEKDGKDNKIIGINKRR